MKLAIMQPYFFPYIGYWQLINAVDEFVIFDDVNYIKRGWINRNRILINGEPTFINVQVKKASQNRRINEIELFDQNEDANKITKTIRMAYRKAPFFEEVIPLVEKLLHHPAENISEFNSYSIMKIAEYLNLKTTFSFSSTMKKDIEALNAEQRIINICTVKGATRYYNAIGGRDLYHQESFEKQGIVLRFVKPRLDRYNQFCNTFIEGLSIIDVMMYNGAEKTRLMLDGSTLIE